MLRNTKQDTGREMKPSEPSATNNTILYHAENNMRIGWIESRIVKAVTGTGPAHFHAYTRSWGCWPVVVLLSIFHSDKITDGGGCRWSQKLCVLNQPFWRLPAGPPYSWQLQTGRQQNTSQPVSFRTHCFETGRIVPVGEKIGFLVPDGIR